MRMVKMAMENAWARPLFKKLTAGIKNKVKLD